MTIKREITLARRAREAQFEREQYTFPAVLLAVDYLNSAAVARQPGHSWFQELGLQEDGEATPGIAFNRKAPGLPGLKVTVKRWPKAPYDYEVVDWDASQIKDLPGYTGTPLLAQHAQDHIDGYDPLILPTRNLSALRTYITPGSTTLTVNVAPYADFGGLNDLDLSSSQPASGLARYVLVYLAGDGTIQVVEGDTATDLETAPPPRPETPAGGIPSAYVRIDGDQAAIAEVDIIEGRRILEQGGGVHPFPAWGEVILHRDDGTFDVYTDLVEAVDAAATDDVLIGLGEFDIGSQLNIDQYIHLTGVNDDPKSFIIRSADETQLNITSRCELASLRVENTKLSGDATAINIASPFSAIVLRNVEVISTSAPGINRAIRVGTTTSVTLIDCNSTSGTGSTQRALYTTGSVNIFGGVYDVFDAITAIESASGGLFLYQLPRIRDGLIGSDGGWYVNNDNQLVDSLGGYQEFDGRSSAPGTPTTERGRIYFDATTKEFRQVDDTGATKSLANASGAPDDAEYYVKSLHAGLSAEIVPPLDEFKASKLRQLDDGGDAVVADNNGNLRLIDHALIFDSGNGDWIITNGSNEVAWVLNTNTRGLLTPTGIVLTGAGQNLRGISDNVPDLGTTTAAEKLGNIYQAAAKDVFAKGDDFGLFNRLVDANRTPGEHFRDGGDDLSWTGYASYTGFASPPSSASYATPSFLKVTHSAATRAFKYRSFINAQTFLIARVMAGATVEAGLMLDDGVDNVDGLGANNFIRAFIEYPTFTTNPNLAVEYRTGGGGVTKSTGLSIPPGQPLTIILLYGLGTRWSSWNFQVYILGGDGGFNFFTAGPDGFSFTPARHGLYFRCVSANNIGGYDSFEEV
jgi:hypothetical protein